MASPGVSTIPILLVSGSSPFCETFFDDVRVPRDQVVGKVNRGRDVAKYLLGHEREMISAMGLAAGGSDALEWESARSGTGAKARSWLRSKGNWIEGGTSEIRLGIVAKRTLMLPG